ELLEEAPPRRERLVAALGAARRRAADADERPEVRLEPGVRRGRAELPRGLVGRVRVEDARLRLDHLAEGPEGHALAVRKAAAAPPRDQLRLTFHRLVQLEHEPALADARNAHEG